ncbi:ATP-binding protein [Mucilaginibacter sp. P25]|uniref:ATP-binding protein n=1 Tax=Mucilaginibacter sp. P25 TaxID=3423945 RepID=UPI003D7BB1B7
MPPSQVPISYQGIFHYRSGSTKQELKGIALQNWLLEKNGKRWEDIPVPGSTLNDLEETSIRSFVGRAVQKGRIPSGAENDPPEVLLENLNLKPGGELSNAAVLLFGKKPSRINATCSFKIGRFGKSSDDLLFQDVIETNLFDMPEKVMEVLKSKYLVRPVGYEGIERTEYLEYPEDALRESVLNAIIHKDYSGTFTFLRVYDDRLEIWNPGTLPDGLTIEKLKGSHPSVPRNANMANVFFMAGYVETWGRGTTKMISSCLAAGLPEPLIEEDHGGFRVVFRKDKFNAKELAALGLSERQIRAALFVKEKGQITNAEYQMLNAIGRSVAATDLQDLVERKVLSRIGATGRGAKYVIFRENA